MGVNHTIPKLSLKPSIPKIPSIPKLPSTPKLPSIPKLSLKSSIPKLNLKRFRQFLPNSLRGPRHGRA